MAQNIFRKSSVDRINSPEQLNDYIKVSSPSVWILLAAVIVLLAAVLIWSATGSLPTQISVNAIAEDGALVCYFSQEDAAKIQEGMNVRLSDGETGSVASIGSFPLSQEEVAAAISDNGDYALHSLNLDEWNVPIAIQADINLQDGRIYPLVITLNSVNPIEFLLNGQGS